MCVPWWASRLCASSLPFAAINAKLRTCALNFGRLSEAVRSYALVVVYALLVATYTDPHLYWPVALRLNLSAGFLFGHLRQPTSFSGPRPQPCTQISSYALRFSTGGRVFFPGLTSLPAALGGIGIAQL